MAQDFLTGNPLDLVKKGWMGPDMSPEAVYAQLIQIMNKGAQSTAGFMGNAASRSGGQTPTDLQARVSAIQQQGVNMANLNLAGAMSSWEQTRASGALDRYMRYWGVTEQEKMANQQAESSLWGNLLGSLAGAVTLGAMK